MVKDHGEFGSSGSSSSSSGWTRYLLEQTDEKNLKKKKLGLEEGDEDMSLVSDASSGPPHFHDDDDVVDYPHDGGSDIFYSASSSSPEPPAIFVKEFSKIRGSVVEEDQCSGVLWASVDDDDTCSTTSTIFSSPKARQVQKRNIRKSTGIKNTHPLHDDDDDDVPEISSSFKVI